MSQVDLKVEGKKSASEQTSEKYEKDEEMEQVYQMDMELPRAAEVVAASRDVNTQPQEQVVAEAEKIVKQYPTDKQRATLEKARAAKAEKRKVRMLEGRQGAQGTPAPDLLNQVTELLNSKFDSVNKVLDDIKQYLPYESPVQTNHQVIPVTSEDVSLPTNPSTYQQVNRTIDNRVAVPIYPDSSTLQKRQRSPSPVQIQAPDKRSYPMNDRYSDRQMTRDMGNNKRRFTDALSSIDFNNQEVSDRARINFNEQGGLPSIRPAGIFF